MIKEGKDPGIEMRRSSMATETNTGFTRPEKAGHGVRNERLRQHKANPPIIGRWAQ